MHLHHVFRIPRSPQNVTESPILQNKSGFSPNGCQVSHSGHVVTVERLFVGSHGVYHYQLCLSVRDRDKYIETGDQTFLNVILHHVGDDSGFSRPNVGRYLEIQSYGLWHMYANDTPTTWNWPPSWKWIQSLHFLSSYLCEVGKSKDGKVWKQGVIVPV